MVEVGHWLVRMQWRPARLSVCLSLLILIHHKVQKFSSGTGWPGWSRKKGRKKVVCVCDQFTSRASRKLILMGVLCYIIAFSALTCLGFGKSIRPVKIICDEVLAWLSVWSEVQMICIWLTWFHCHPILSWFFKIQIGFILLCWLIQVVLEKRPLNGCLWYSVFWLVMHVCFCCVRFSFLSEWLTGQTTLKWLIFMQNGSLSLDSVH